MVHFLVAVDDSRYGILAFQRALRTASPGDTMFLLTVVDKIASKQGKIAEENKKMFRKICAEKKVRCVNLVEVGNPREVIVQMADNVGADVLVLGSRGQSKLRKVFIGSTTDFCLRNAKCSILVAKKPEDSHLRETMPYIPWTR